MAWQFSPEALVGTRRLGRISKPIIRLALCIVAVLAVVVALSVIHVQQDRILSAALNLFLIVVLIASICWGTGYAIFVSFLSTLGFMGSLRPFGYFHLSDGRIWTLLTACLVTGVVASRLSSRVRQSDKQLRDVIETIPAMAFSILPDGSTAFVNGRVLEYTGLSADTISGPGWQSTVHPEDFESHMTKWLAAMASGEPFENEVRHRNAKGEYRWFLVRAVPLRDAQGKILKWYGILTDIEDRKRSEDELRTALSERAQLAVVREEIGMALAHKDNLRGILHECVETVVRHLDAAFARIWTLSSDGTELQLQASAGMYRHLDGRHSRIPFGELKVGQIAKERKAYLTNDVQNDPRVSDREWARNEKMISFAGYPLVVEDRVVGVMGMFSRRALTHRTLDTLAVVADGIAQGIERKRAEEALRQSEQRLRNVINTIPAMAWSTSPDGANDFANQSWLEYAGMSSKDASGTGWEVTFHPADIATHVEKWRASLATGNPFENEARMQRASDGQYRWFLHRAVPFRDENGNVLRWYGISTDIEDRKRAEAERERLRQLEADLAHMNRVSVMGELAASLAHEIKQPMSAAALNAKTCLLWLQREPPDIGEAREAASSIIKEVMRAADIIDRNRSLYRRDTPEREMVDPNELIREMIVVLRDAANRHSVSIRTEVDESLPMVTADRVQLQQVLMNLMLNGIEAMKDTGGELTISSRKNEDGQVLLSVSDVGIGLPVEKADRIFDAFFTTKTQGTGMGLSICRRIIESHGGKLWATANSGRGASFHFILPAASSASSTSAA